MGVACRLLCTTKHDKSEGGALNLKTNLLHRATVAEGRN